jgi:hypothetical protein
MLATLDVTITDAKRDPRSPTLGPTLTDARPAPTRSDDSTSAPG